VKLIYRNEINLEKWDALVRSKPDAAVFSLSTYLDAVAENWCIYVDENYTKGIAVPFTIRLGVKICYTPKFITYIEWFGTQKSDFSEVITSLKAHFSQGFFSVLTAPDSNSPNPFVCQVIPLDSVVVYNSQANRMFSKFEKSHLKVAYLQEENTILEIIRQELPAKVASLDTKALDSLAVLLSALKKEGLLKTLAVSENGNVVGGLFLVDFNESVLYLKGAFTKESKKNGAMYGAMKFFIEATRSEQKMVDFGGSRVEGVKRFNTNLGGTDRIYSYYEWNHAPFWFNCLKWLKNRVKGKN
jgi:hypothetical protein